jgi:hypothetical protein
MDDIDLHLAHGPQIAALTRLLHTITKDPAITPTNAGFLVCDVQGAGALSPCLMAAVAVGEGQPGIGGNSTCEDQDERLVRFVQFAIDGSEITIDQPTTTLAIREGERLLREREGFHMERRMAPSSNGSSTFCESLVKTFPAAVHPDALLRCQAAARDAVWILHELWGLDPQAPIQLTTFTHDGSGRLASLSGPLHRGTP